MAIGEEYQTEYSHIYITDALSDGDEISIAFEANALGQEPVFLLTELTAVADEESLPVQITEAKGFADPDGFWLSPDAENRNFAMVAKVGPAPGTDIMWTLRLAELKPLWLLRTDNVGYADDGEDGPSYEAWGHEFHDAYQKQEILLMKGGALLMFKDTLPPGDTLEARLTASGAFAKTGEMTSALTSEAASTAKGLSDDGVI